MYIFWNAKEIRFIYVVCVIFPSFSQFLHLKVTDVLLLLHPNVGFHALLMVHLLNFLLKMVKSDIFSCGYILLFTGNIDNINCKICVFIVHTMDELKLTGNCLKGSRPILSFDKVIKFLKALCILLCSNLFYFSFMSW